MSPESPDENFSNPQERERLAMLCCEQLLQSPVRVRFQRFEEFYKAMRSLSEFYKGYVRVL